MKNLQDILAGSQIICVNPVKQKETDYKICYYTYLKSLVRTMVSTKGKYVRAQLAFYKAELCGENSIPRKMQPALLEQADCLLMPFDIVAIIGFQALQKRHDRMKALVYKMECDLSLSTEQKMLLSAAFEAACGKQDSWKQVMEYEWAGVYGDYLQQVRKNAEFVSNKPYNVLVTANMSAGKSTLINALVGKNINLTQNLACTSKIHMIVSKPFEDGVISENDHLLSFSASKEELLSDNEQNQTGKITVGTYFAGELAGKRLVLIDSPGVNSSENSEHTVVTHRMIQSGKYRLLIYVMNATQLGTTDEAAHLKYVKDRLGRRKILFVINKADQLLLEDEDIGKIISNQKQFLESLGFKDPVICPVSARAAYLAKKELQEELSRWEYRELENLMYKFECNSFANYYERVLKCDPIFCENEYQSLFRNSGFLYLEKLMIEFTKWR